MFKLQDRPENICVFYSVIGRISVFRLVFFIFVCMEITGREDGCIHVFFIICKQAGQKYLSCII